jgi:hypothetical protein
MATACAHPGGCAAGVLAITALILVFLSESFLRVKCVAE